MAPRLLRRAGTIWDIRKKQAGQWLLHSPLHPLYLMIFRPKRPQTDADYRRWLALEEATWVRSRSDSWSYRPTVSVVVPTYRPKLEWLEKAVASVKAQSYENWELCICDDGSGDSAVVQFLQDAASADPRVRYCLREKRGGISAALNDAGRLATGEVVTFLDHDDEVHRDALHYVVEAMQEGTEVVYSDEDYLDPAGLRAHPTFKPAWSPELLSCCMYFGHLFAAKRSLIEKVGWFRSECDGAQDYDLALRVTEQARKVRHIPRVLYHWRQHEQSTSLNPAAKPYAHQAGKTAAADAIARRGIGGTIQDGPLLYTFYIRRNSTKPKASLIVCSCDARQFATFLKARQRTVYQNIETVVVEHARKPGALSRLVGSTDCVRVPYNGPFDFAHMNHLGALAATSDYLVFINDDVTPIAPEWLATMVAHLERPEIGIVGALLRYPSGAIQHAGIAVGIHDGAGHPGRGVYQTDLMYYLTLPRDVSAVTGACLGIRREVFQELGGFDKKFPINYNDVDFCLRARERGYRIIVDPRIELTHIESASRERGTTLAERQTFRERWGAVLDQGDPYYPRVFDPSSEDVRLPLNTS